MASIVQRNEKYCVVYNYVTAENERKQKWETFGNLADAKKRKNEVEYLKDKQEFSVAPCKTIKDLMSEYVPLYGKKHWALSTYTRNTKSINQYIIPLIGNTKLSEINTMFLEKFYENIYSGDYPLLEQKIKKKQVAYSQIVNIHKILRNAFRQAVKWNQMDKNPAQLASIPKKKAKKRDIWTADIVMYAIDMCQDEKLSIALNLAFSCSLRMGEILGLTWDCVDISEEAIQNDSAYLYVNKELQRVTKESLLELEGKDVLLMFPGKSVRNTTVVVLKTPKTDSSIRKVFIPKSVAKILVRWKEEQDILKGILGSEYRDYNLVMATSTGMPISDSQIRNSFNKLIDEYKLPKVVFHSLRHTSITYKLKLNGGDIKAVQGDSGHSQVGMVTDLYCHIIDEDRRKNAIMFEEAFYNKKISNPDINEPGTPEKVIAVPEQIDAEALAKVLANPEMAALIASMAKAIQ